MIKDLQNEKGLKKIFMKSDANFSTSLHMGKVFFTPQS